MIAIGQLGIIAIEEILVKQGWQNQVLNCQSDGCRAGSEGVGGIELIFRLVPLWQFTSVPAVRMVCRVADDGTFSPCYRSERPCWGFATRNSCSDCSGGMVFHLRAGAIAKSIRWPAVRRAEGAHVRLC